MDSNFAQDQLCIATWFQKALTLTIGAPLVTSSHSPPSSSSAFLLTLFSFLSFLSFFSSPGCLSAKKKI